VLYATGNKTRNLYFPRAGAILLGAELASGEMIGTALVGRDNVIGGGMALVGLAAVHAAVVLIDGSGLALDIESARQIAAGNEEFRTALAWQEQLILAQAQQSAACNAVHSLDQRLARWLLRVQDVTGSDSFKVTQDFMANMLGVRRTSVSMVAHALREAHLIDYQRGKMTILQPEALREHACECYSGIKNQYERQSALAQSVPAL
jgi:CRP-like cAMP-binding protein